MPTRFEYVDKFNEYFIENLDDYDDLRIYRFKDLDLKWLKSLLSFGENVFGEDSFDVFAIVTQIFYGNVFVLKERTENKILGIAALNRCWDDETHTVYLADYAIAEEARGVGLGTRFLKRVLSNLQSQGVKLVRLTVDIENDPAIGLYEKVGFEILKEHRDLYGPGAHRYIMEKTLE